MTLYKASMETEQTLEPKKVIDMARQMVNVQVTKDSTLSVEALIDPGASKKFISQQLPKNKAVDTASTY